MLIYDVILDVGTTGSQQTVSLYRGDDRLKMLRITLLQDGRPYAVASDMNVRLHGVKPDDAAIAPKCGVRGGSVYCLPAAGVTDTEGTVRCQLQIRDHSGAVLFTPEFSLEIAASIPAPELPDGASEDVEFNAEVLSELSASASGRTLLFRGEPIGGIPAVSELPEDADEDAIVYLIDDGLYRFADESWTQITDDALLGELASLQTGGHTHDNKAVLDTITANVVADSHTHANKSALDAVTAAKVTGWDAAADKKHTHDNKAVLDTVTANVVTDRHTHANKAVLDTVTTSKITGWNAASDSKHTHANKSALDAVTAAKVADWNAASDSKHSHANKSALDAVTAGKVADWDAAAGDTHTHDNKAVLDTVTSAQVTRWDNAANNSHMHDNLADLSGVTLNRVMSWDENVSRTNILMAASHGHQNKEALDRFTGTANAISYNGKQIPLIAPDDVTLMGFGTYSNLLIRDNAISGESIQDVPIFVQGVPGDDICKLFAYTPGEEYDHIEPYDMIALSEMRQADTGMPLFILRVMMGGEYCCYVPQAWNDSGSHIIPAGWVKNNQPCDPPTITNFTPNRISFDGVDYSDLLLMPEAGWSALRSLSQCINVSAAAMGTLSVPDDAVLRFAGTFVPNRKYVFQTSRDCTFTLPAVPWSEQDAQFVLYLTCTADVDLTFPQTTKFVGDLPNSDTGSHKLFGSYLPGEGVWSVGGVDYKAVT